MGTLTLAVTRPGISLEYSGASLHLDTHQGMSAYQSYLSTTDDDPPLSEAEWSATPAKELAEDIQDLQNRMTSLENTAIQVTTTHW